MSMHEDNMPAYIVDATGSFCYTATVIAESAEEAEQIVEKYLRRRLLRDDERLVGRKGHGQLQLTMVDTVTAEEETP